jgi:hypothetical protein
LGLGQARHGQCSADSQGFQGSFHRGLLVGGIRPACTAKGLKKRFSMQGKVMGM